MRQIVFLIACLLMGISGGCKFIVMKLYGVRQPKFETGDRLNDFFKSNGWPQGDRMALTPEQWLRDKSFRMPDVFVFNNAGKYIPYRDSLHPNCNGPVEEFLSELNPRRQYHISPQYVINDFSAMLQPEACYARSLTFKEDADFYIFITWAKFIGAKLQKEKTRTWLDALENNKNIRFQLVWVNQDFQDCWPLAVKNQVENTFSSQNQ